MSISEVLKLLSWKRSNLENIYSVCFFDSLYMDLIPKPSETNIFVKYSLSFPLWRIVAIILKIWFLLEIHSHIQDKKEGTNLRGGREEKSSSEEGMADVAE